MSGQGSRNRRKIRREQGGQSKRNVQSLGARYPVSKPWFYIYGETYVKGRHAVSPVCGPFCHVRAASTFWMGSSHDPNGPKGNEIIAYLEPETNLWIINHPDADPAGYYEVVLYIDENDP